MSKPNGCHEDDRDRDETARTVRGTKKADPKVPVIDRMRLIVKECQANRINGVYIDLFTASCVTQVYDAVNEANKKRLDALPVRKLVDVVYKVLNKTRAS
jgi:hypothetical protein